MGKLITAHRFLPHPPVSTSREQQDVTHTLESNSRQKQHTFHNGIQPDVSSALGGGGGRGATVTPGPTLLSHSMVRKEHKA